MAQMIIMYVASKMVSAFLTPKEDELKEDEENKEKSARIQTNEYGVLIPRIWGTIRIAGNVIWIAPIPSESAWVESLYIYVAIAVCKGPAELLRIWANKKLIYDNRPVNRGATTLYDHQFFWYEGESWQVPDPFVMEFHEGAGNVPGHRDFCYLLMNVPLHEYGYRLPNFEFEVTTYPTTTPDQEFEVLDDSSSSATDRDNIVFYENDMYFVIVSDGSWRKYNTFTRDKVLSIEHQSPKIPAYDGGFDSDEAGIIHTVKATTGDKSVLCRLDGDTFAEIAAGSLEMQYAPDNWRIRVFRTSSYPYLVCTWGTSVKDQLLITSRYSYTFGGVDEILLDPPSYTKWAAFDLDEDEGIIWAVCKSTDATPRSRVVKITVFNDGSYTREVWDVTNRIGDSDAVVYDSETDTLIIGSSSDEQIIFFDADTMTYDSEHVIHEPSSKPSLVSDVKSSWRRGIINDFLIFGSPQDTAYSDYHIHTLDIVLREIVSTTMTTWDGGDPHNGYAGSCFCRLTQAVILSSPNTYSYYYEASYDYIKAFDRGGDVQNVPLSTIVEDICEECGLSTVNDLDVTDLSGIPVRGFGITRQMTARSALELLMSAYFFDIIDTGGVLKFKLRGEDATFNLTEEDLGAHLAGNERPQTLVSTRQQELELPSSIDITYLDHGADYAFAVQRERRLITESKERHFLTLPIVMTKDEAKQICVKHMALAWKSRTRYEIATHREFLYLDAGDVGTITRNGTTYTVRIEEVGIRGGMIILKMIEESSATYESDATGTIVPGGDDEDGVDYTGYTLLILLDCSLIRATENAPGVQVVTLGYGNQWTGAAIFKSDADVWPLQQPWTMTTKDAIIAKSLDALADVTDPWIWDEGSSVNVLLIDSTDTLSSATKADVLNGSNLAILGDEIIQWRTATLEDDGTYTLTGLLRGRRGTEWATGTHAVGEYFILLNTENVAFEEVSIDEKGIVKWYRPASFGMDWMSGTVQSFVFAGNNMKPWSPERVEGTRDVSNNLTIIWIRRTRMNGEWTDGGDAALGETTEAYEVDILDGSTVVRTIEVTSESATYTAAQQTNDGLTPGDPVDMIIYQISTVIDRGFGTEATV